MTASRALPPRLGLLIIIRFLRRLRALLWRARGLLLIQRIKIILRMTDRQHDVASGSDARLVQQIPQRLHGIVRVAIESSATDAPETPAASLQLTASRHIRLIPLLPQPIL